MKHEVPEELRRAAAMIGKKLPSTWSCTPRLVQTDTESIDGVAFCTEPHATEGELEFAACDYCEVIECYHEQVAELIVVLLKIRMPVAEWLSAEKRKWDETITRDRPKCPSCDGSIPCHHPEEDYHDGGQTGWGCDRVYGDPEDPCKCWDHSLAVARARNEGLDE